MPRWADAWVRTADSASVLDAIKAGITPPLNLIIDHSGQADGHGVKVSVQDHTPAALRSALLAAGIEPISVSARIDRELTRADVELDGAA